MKRKIVFLLTCLLLLFPLSACKKNISLSSYVSEFRREIYFGETSGFTLYAYFSSVEYPSFCDGIKANLEDVVSLVLTAPKNDVDYAITFSYDGKEYGGDMPYDNVEKNYSFSVSCPCIDKDDIHFMLTFNSEKIELPAKKLTGGKLLSVDEICSVLEMELHDLISENTDRFGFHGEIKIRAVYTEKTDFYVAVYTRKNQSVYLLLDGKNGEVLAKK